MDPTLVPKQTSLPGMGLDSLPDLSHWACIYDVCYLSECEDTDMVITNVDMAGACGVVAALNANSVSQAVIDGHLGEFRSVTDVCAAGWVAMESLVIRRRSATEPTAH